MIGKIYENTGDIVKAAHFLSTAADLDPRNASEIKAAIDRLANFQFDGKWELD